MKPTDTRALTPRPSVMTKLDPNYWPSAQAVLDEHRKIAGLLPSSGLRNALLAVGAVLCVVVLGFLWSMR